jgi:poly(hydroxyalkanoate) depolymerase family esterase
MFQATRLTREGRLTEATAFLRRLLQSAPAPPADPTPLTIEGVAETIELADAPPAPTPPAHRMDVNRGRSGGFATRTSSAGRRRELVEPDNGVGFTAPLRGFAYPAPTENAAVLPPGAKFLSATFSNPAGTRPYKLYVPSGYDGQSVPLIVMLHGCTQSPDDFAAGTRMNAAAEEHDCLVVYPAQTSAANMSKCWNWFSVGDQQRDRGEPSLIAGITREVMDKYSIDPRRVYVAGLSAGAAAAAIMGDVYPDLYAAIGVHSGLACGAAHDLPSAFAAMRQGKNERGNRNAVQSVEGKRRRIVPTIVFHGDRDTTVHPRNGDDVVAQSALTMSLVPREEKGRVIGGYTYTRFRHADASGQTLLEQWLVHGAGHAWSGGSPAGSYTDPRGPDATKEMLRFFFEHPQSADTGAVVD